LKFILEIKLKIDDLMSFEEALEMQINIMEGNIRLLN
jgi:hypothetical protein